MFIATSPEFPLCIVAGAIDVSFSLRTILSPDYSFWGKFRRGCLANPIRPCRNLPPKEYPGERIVRNPDTNIFEMSPVKDVSIMSLPLLSTTVLGSFALWQWFGVQEAEPIFLLCVVFGAIRGLIDFTRDRKAWARYVDAA